MKKFLILIFAVLTATACTAQVKVVGRIIPNSVTDLYPTHIDSLGKGGLMTATTWQERNAIPIERRKAGMLVRIKSATVDSTYTLGVTLANNSWTAYSPVAAVDISGKANINGGNNFTGSNNFSTSLTPTAGDYVVNLAGFGGVNISGPTGGALTLNEDMLKISFATGGSSEKSLLFPNNSGTFALVDDIPPAVDISGKADKTITVNGQELSADVTITKSDVGLSNVPNTDFTSAVTANTAKVGISPTQASNIVTNNSKVSYTDGARVAAITDADYKNSNTTKAQVGLGSVDNTSDANKPVSTAQQTALNLKADDNTVVKLAGNQTIAGSKTWSGSGNFNSSAWFKQVTHKNQGNTIGTFAEYDRYSDGNFAFVALTDGGGFDNVYTITRASQVFDFKVRPTLNGSNIALVSDMPKIFTHSVSWDVFSDGWSSGETSNFKVAHNLSYTPSMVSVTANSSEAVTLYDTTTPLTFFSTADATYVYIIYNGIAPIGNPALTPPSSILKWTILVK